MSVTGPLFAPRSIVNAKVDRQVEAMIQTLADETIATVRRRLDNVLVNPSGYYRSRIAKTSSPNRTEVHDSRVVYGPWLEGVGSRNATTRFKGYSTFRRTREEIMHRAPWIIRDDVVKLVRQLG